MLSRTLAITLAVICAGNSGAAEKTKLNVLFVMADDLRPELASFGSPRSHRTRPVGENGACSSTRPTANKLVKPSRSSMLTAAGDTLKLWHNGLHFPEKRIPTSTRCRCGSKSTATRSLRR